MGAQNGYAQLVVRDDETFVSIYPPQEGGKPIDINELTEYLGRNLMTQYDMARLRNACKTGMATEVFVGPAPYHPFNESMMFRVSPDNMLVFCKFYPASEGGSLMTEESIIDELRMNKIIQGYDVEMIRNYLNNRVYNTEFIFAKGTPPRHGKDGKVEYFFNTSLSTRPKKNEDGTVDYHDLNTVSMVEKGQRLAHLILPDEGTPGEDVYGNPIKPRSVKVLRLEYGNNISISDDGMDIFTNVTGHATVVNGKVFVSDILEIPADVDTSTGDISYSGTVMIRGNVKSGFRVKAQGDVIVEGVVEGAEIISDGQIIIKRGIHGMTKGVLRAKGNVICKFIENAKVFSGGYIETESILHSEVSAFSTVHISGRKGFATGGMIRAGKIVEAQIIGSEMGTATRIEVGTDPDKKARFVELQRIMVEQRKEQEQLKPILESYTKKYNEGVNLSKDNMEYIQKVAHSFKELKVSIAANRMEYEKLHEEIMMSEGARVKVSNVIYPGVLISIGDVSLTTKDVRHYCQFLKQGGEVVTINL